MRKKWLAALLTVVLVTVLAAGVLPGAARAAEPELPDWYFLFAIFKNVDADCADGKGTTTHTKTAMSQEEIDLVYEKIESFEAYMNSTGVMRAHVDTIEIGETITELEHSSASTLGSYLGSKQAAPLLENAGVDLDRYDFVSCYTSLNVATVYGGVNSAGYENGTGHSCFNLRNIEFAQPDHVSVFPGTSCVHEFLHFMEKESKRWGTTFDLHSVREQFYAADPYEGGWNAYHYKDGWEACYTDIILNRIEGDAELGTGVNPAVWQYPPHVLRTTRELTVPDGVTAIGDYAFRGLTNLKKVVIPDGVTGIGYGAFYECDGLESVSIPGSVTAIGEHAFRGCGSLKTVAIPSGVTNISYCAFYDCSGLESVSIPGSVTAIGEHAFRGCGSLKAVAIPNSVTSIGEYAFRGCGSLKTVAIPNGVTGIGTWTFGECESLTAIYLPAGVTDIGYAAFWKTGLTDVYYGGTQARWNAVRLDEYNSALTGAAVHYNSTGLGADPGASRDLPEWRFLIAVFKNVDADGVDYYGAASHTVYSMTQEEVDIARDNYENFFTYMNSVGVMSAYVDYLVIDTPVTQLQESEYGSYLSAEYAAPILEANGVELDEYDHITCVVSLNIITGYYGITGADFENGAGVACINFRNLACADREFRPKLADYPMGTFVHEFLHFMERMGKKFGSSYDLHITRDGFYTPTTDDWYACYTDILLNRVDGTAESGTGVFPIAWQFPPRLLRTATELTVPAGVTAIGDYAFLRLSNLKKVTLPAGVTSIGEYAFYGCTGLESVSLPAGVTSLGDYAFYGCGSLKDITLPAGLTGIGRAAFYECGSLERVAVPAGVTEILDYTFYGCAGLKSVAIPQSVTGIGYAGFYGTGLKDVYYSGLQSQWKAIQIGEYNSPLTAAAIHYRSSGPASNARAFSDVPNGAWYAGAVDWAVTNGITSGTGSNQFSPNKTCTRAEIVTFLWRAYGKPEPTTATNRFTDIRPTDWYYKAVLWAVETGITSGTGKGLFNPGGICTRQEAVTFQYRAAGEPAVTGRNPFNDVSNGVWYTKAVLWAVETGITGGTGGNQFSPGKTCTRAEIVTFLFRDPGILA